MILKTQMRSFFETYPFPSLVLNIDEHFTIADINKSYLHAFSCREKKKRLKKSIGLSLFQLFPKNKNGFRKALDQVLSTKESLKTDILIQEDADPHEKNPHWDQPVLTPILNTHGEVDLVICSLLPRENQNTAVDKTSGKACLSTNQINRDQQELKEQLQLLDKAYRLARIGIWEFDMQTHELQWSDITKEVHGFGPNYEPDLESTINLFKEGINRQEFARAAREAIEEEKSFDVELKIISGQGDERWIRATGEPEYQNGVCTRFYGISQNITGRKKAEEEVLLNEQRFRSLVQDGSDLVTILDCDANYQYVSPTSQAILGIPAEDFIGTNVLSYIHPDDRERITDIVGSLSPGRHLNVSPFRFRDAEGKWRWMETTLTNMIEDPAVGGLVANSRDVTDQKRQQQKILETLKEKETLLAEIHHRVKNNLAVVSGMMQLQIMEEDNSELTERLLDSILRIKTMANIHDHLYQSKSFSELDYNDNIRSLVIDIQKTLQSDTEIQINFNCEQVKLDINQAIPCSLIVNEVVTNIFKHAFPKRNTGHIFINLSESAKKNRLHLTIKDDGVGMPRDLNRASSGSLGLNLIGVLSQQLEAEYQFDSSEEGTAFRLQFKKDSQKGIGNSLL